MSSMNKVVTEFNIPALEKFKSLSATSSDIKDKINQFEREDRVLRCARKDLRDKINRHIELYVELEKKESRRAEL